MCPFLLWPSTYYWFVTIKIILYVPFLWSVESFTSQKLTTNLQSIGSFLECWFIYFSQVNYQSQVYRLFFGVLIHLLLASRQPICGESRWYLLYQKSRPIMHICKWPCIWVGISGVLKLLWKYINYNTIFYSKFLSAIVFLFCVCEMHFANGKSYDFLPIFWTKIYQSKLNLLWSFVSFRQCKQN